jgi:AraC-like DNA-binding protein
VANVPHLTAGVDTADQRVERFQQLASDAFAPLRIRADETAGTNGPVGTLCSAKPGQVLVTRIAGGPCTVLRTRSLIGSGDRELVKVALYGRGRAGVEQDGRQCLPGQGDLVVYETARPYELRFWDSFDIVVLGIPRKLLGPYATPLASRTASPVPTDGGGRRLAAALLRDVASDLDACAGSGGPHLADALVSVVLSALAEQPVSARPAEDLAERILTYCLGRLSDPRLSPESVARAHRVSVRYLHKVLQQREVTLASWIRGRRLERIRRDLADPALADRSVSVIAAGWGILDATHLSRALRAEFGQSAAEIRKSAPVVRRGDAEGADAAGECRRTG